ncbi:hypothetical protein OH77DRAFT_783022 [Trametes cingulata]|nr:hypothetical protein OH77DRAFT_783022 [Trametes cingulata]
MTIVWYASYVHIAKMSRPYDPIVLAYPSYALIPYLLCTPRYLCTRFCTTMRVPTHLHESRVSLIDYVLPLL